MSDGRQKMEIDTPIGKANAVLRELYCSVVTKRELPKPAKFSFSIDLCSVPAHACGQFYLKYSTNGRDGIFVKNPWSEASRKSAQLSQPSYHFPLQRNLNCADSAA